MTNSNLSPFVDDLFPTVLPYVLFCYYSPSPSPPPECMFYYLCLFAGPPVNVYRVGCFSREIILYLNKRVMYVCMYVSVGYFTAFILRPEKSTWDCRSVESDGSAVCTPFWKAGYYAVATYPELSKLFPNDHNDLLPLILYNLYLAVIAQFFFSFLFFFYCQV